MRLAPLQPSACAIDANMCPWDRLQPGRCNFPAATSTPSVLAVLQASQREFDLGKGPDIILHANVCQLSNECLLNDSHLIILLPVDDHLRPVGIEPFEQLLALAYERFPAFIQNRTFSSCPTSHEFVLQLRIAARLAISSQTTLAVRSTAL